LQIFAPLPPPGGLVGWWRAETNAQDSAGTNNGTPLSGTTYAAGKVGQAFALNGSTTYVSVPDSPSLRPASLTLEAWVMFYSAVANRAIGYDTHAVLLGADVDNGGTDLFLNGRIDEASIYSRALSATEIVSIYNAGSAGKTALGPYFVTPPALPAAVASRAYT